MFEIEKERIKLLLFGKRNLNLQKSYKQKLDELYALSICCLSTKLGYMTGTTMLLSIYLASKHVSYSIQLLNSLIKEIILDPVNLHYDEYIEKFQGLAKNFVMAPYDDVPIYYDESDWDRYDFQKNYGDKLNDLFPSFPCDFYWRDDKRLSPDYKFATFEQTLNSLFLNGIYLRNGIINYFGEIIDGLLDITDYQRFRLDDSGRLKNLFEQRKNDYMSCSIWIDARNEVYNEIRLLGEDKNILQILNGLKIQYLNRFKDNRLGALFMQTNRIEFFVYDLEDPLERATQIELNEFFKLHCQYELVCKLLDYHTLWSINNKNPLFINKGTECIMNAMVPYLARKVFNGSSNESYAALYRALIDLKLSYKRKSKNFMNWVNDTFLKDGHASTANGKMNTPKSVTQPFESLYGKEYKDLMVEEISEIPDLETMKPFYQKSIWILSKAFGIDLKERGFQPWITECPDVEEFTSDFQSDAESVRILECFRAYETFLAHQS